MRFPRAAEAEVIAGIEADPQQCVTLSPEAYTRKDGAILVSRDYLQELLHRRLYRLIVDESLGRNRLERVCESWGCINPWHYRSTGTAPATTHCRKGHELTLANLTPAGYCRTCYADRVAARTTGRPDAATIQRNKTTCPNGHDYTPENTYISRTKSGQRRKCRTCAKQQAADYRTRHHQKKGT